MVAKEEVELKEHISLGGVVATIGSILIALGIAWLIGLNWNVIPSALKILILVIITAGAYTAGVLFRIKDYDKIGGSLLVLGALSYTLSIFLIAQIFNLSTSLQLNAFLLLLSWGGILFAAYIFDSSPSLIVALVEFLIWISLQYFSFVELFRGDFSVGILVIIYLIVAVGLYGLTQLHKSMNHEFSGIYRYWTAFYILALTYVLSFQILLPALWPEGFVLSAEVLIFLIIISVVAIVLAIIGIYRAVSKNKLSGKEVLSFVILVLVYILLITLASFVSGESVFSGSLSMGLWFMWLFDNFLFILVILAVIGYGTRYKSAKIVNLAIIFFALDIVTRYIGFVMDFGGQIGFAVMSILGGIILIAGGWGIEKWRRHLVEKTNKKAQQNYAVY
ncbi:DUF2157 domain-containing protein [archaeon]|jgi:uncharacterized membrane protein|nr:DUF2157 domain-containing protein [archaeon]MBT4241324.1 DUF2157 domain-containing protein [archaeon]MBT4418145.1 DUF2157 domain-containing protein [archaeon]